jgi:hypothetical protein
MRRSNHYSGYHGEDDDYCSADNCEADYYNNHDNKQSGANFIDAAVQWRRHCLQGFVH